MVVYGFGRKWPERMSTPLVVIVGAGPTGSPIQTFGVVKCSRDAEIICGKAADPARDRLPFIPHTLCALPPIPDITCVWPKPEWVKHILGIIGGVEVEVDLPPEN